jgi:hypothetical protein
MKITDTEPCWIFIATTFTRGLSPDGMLDQD